MFRTATLAALVWLLAACTSATDPTTRSAGRLLDDNVLARTATINIRNASDDLQRSNLSVASFNGVVLLVGQVPDEEAKRLAEEEVDKLQNVRRIYNELEIAGPTSMLTRSGDSWVTSKVKTQLLTDEEVRGRHIKVTTENGVTYLMGLVTRSEAERATEITRSTSGVRQVVRLFEYVDD